MTSQPIARSRAPVPYFGGKQTIARRIADRMPAHEHYVEPFAGSLAVLLAKPPSAHETVNDLDGDLMCFWRVLRDQPNELHRVCAATPHSRHEFIAARDLGPDLPDLERARRLWVTLTQGRAGRLQRTGWRHYVSPASSGVGMPGYLDGYRDRIRPVAERIAGVSLECRPALEVIRAYGGSPEVLLYTDPPYLGAARSSSDPQYRHELRTSAEHEELLDALLACRAAVVLSGYASDLYDARLAEWDRVEIKTSTGNGRPGEKVRTEVLWSNRPLGRQRALWEVGA